MYTTNTNTFETINYRGLTIKINYDEYGDSPRDWDNIGTMYTSCRNFCPDCELEQYFDIDEVFSQRRGKMFKDSFLAKYIALPLYLYEHSGYAIQTTPFGNRWDSGMIGIIAVSLEEARKQFPNMPDSEVRSKAIDAMQSEVEIYNDYLHGEVYEYLIEELEADEEFCNDCRMSGFYGDGGIESAIDYAKSVIDSYLKELETRKPKVEYVDNGYVVIVTYIGEYTATKAIA